MVMKWNLIGHFWNHRSLLTRCNLAIFQKYVIFVQFFVYPFKPPLPKSVSKARYGSTSELLHLALVLELHDPVDERDHRREWFLDAVNGNVVLRRCLVHWFVTVR